jgi:hypothetical protein
VPPQPQPNAARVIGAVATQTAWTTATPTSPASDVYTIDNYLKLR